MQDGILMKILVPPGETAPVRKIVGVLALPGEAVDLEALLAEDVQGQPSSPQQIQSKSANNVDQPASFGRPGTIIASPLVKRTAREKGIDLQEIKGTGPGGRIQMEDLHQASTGAASAESRAALPGRTVPLNTLRKVLVKRLAQAAADIPMVTLHAELDMSPIIQYRSSRKDAEKPGINAFLVLAAAKALRACPGLNASFEGDAIRLHEQVNIGLAVDTAEGLMVVVCQQADQKNVIQIQQELDALVHRARNRQSSPGDLEGSTFTLTNLGALGVDSFNPILNPPEAGILGVGRIREQAHPGDNEGAGQYVATFSLTFDHRVIDGAPAAQFLQKLQEILLSVQDLIRG
jgi:pyruvate dehydrogenase E2 component (dihydrolipoamide acetyltransferase)